MCGHSAVVLLLLVFGAACRADDYKGILTAECVRTYFEVMVARRVPPRTYRYYHEVTSADTAVAERGDVHVGWRIVGGKAITIEEAPYQVLYGRYCGGSLVAPQWVVTAAHCRDKEEFVYAGSTLRSRTAPHKVCAHFVHPQWRAGGLHSHDYDYQLVLLERAVAVTPATRPIAIGSLDDVKPGHMVAVTGWGHMKFKTRMQDHLRRVYVPIMDDDTCKGLPNGFFRNITERMFCAGFMNGTKDSCQGDSGGPAVYNGKLVGVVSFGVNCAMPQQPGVYSKLPLAREWIRSVTALPL